VEARLVVYDNFISGRSWHLPMEDERLRIVRADIDYGLDVVGRRTFDAVTKGEICDLGQVDQTLLEQDRFAALEVFDRFYEIGSHVDLEETRRPLAGRPQARNLHPQSR
jgi:hypothetical protein